MFNKILIANRGEIAVRVARTARRMGIKTVAVYSDADAAAMHVAACDEAVHIGAPPPRESYLLGERIIAAAKATGAQAIHPGYGFLSENEDFADACTAAGLVFIGPPTEAIRAMGSKVESKRLMGAANVPLVPGYHGDDQSDALLQAEADSIGYPVLIKASAGGGGKGMKVAANREEFLAQLASAKREAINSFGDDQVLLEKYLQEPRHIEIQVFADTHGNCVYLFERDCSVQRRHQKVLEEAPAPGMTPERRAQMGAAAVAAAQAVGYVGAGTVEFIAEQDGRFYFMEMNTRLQVEHPVTEMITGLDLVEWQLRVAAGERLPKLQPELAINGHAIEARVYAEDPDKGFLPAIGRLQHLREPATGPQLRIDTGVRAGDEISQFYDPMIAKLIVWGEDRATALRRLSGALAEYQIVGLSTNVEFLQRVVSHHAFAGAKLDTGLIARYHDELFPPPQPVPDTALALATLAELADSASAVAGRAMASAEPNSPWNLTSGWWLNDDNHRQVVFRETEAAGDAEPREITIVVHYKRGADGERQMLDLPGGSVQAELKADGDGYVLNLGGRRCRGHVVQNGQDRIVYLDGQTWRLQLIDRLAAAMVEDGVSGHLTAPMPGTIVAVLVAPGDRVTAGQPLLVLEAMKMEHTISAPRDGVIKAVFYGVKEQVTEGAELIDLDAE